MFPHLQIVLLVLCFTTKETERVFHYLYTATFLVGAVTYYVEASNLGWSIVDLSTNLDHGSTRQMYYAKYVNWVIAFPSGSLSLGLLSGISWTTILTNLFLSWFWILNYLIAAYVNTSHKWGFFAFGTFGWFILAMSTINESHDAASKSGFGRDYRILSLPLNFCWLLYPIAFGLSDGGHIISVDSSFIFFGILDIVSVPLWSFVFLLLTRGWSYERLHLDFSEHRFLPTQQNEPKPPAEAIPNEDHLTV